MFPWLRNNSADLQMTELVDLKCLQDVSHDQLTFNWTPVKYMWWNFDFNGFAFAIELYTWAVPLYGMGGSVIFVPEIWTKKKKN